MKNKQVWKKSYDPGMEDLDPREWERTVPGICQRSFQSFPEKTALAFMGVHISFAQLDRYANKFASMLIHHGFKKGDVVAIDLPNIPEYVIAWLGTLRAGCVVSGISPLLSTEELAYQLKDSNAKGLVTLDAIFAGRLIDIVSDLPDLKLVVATSVGGFLPWIKRVLGRVLKKIPYGKVTPLEGRTVYYFKEVLNANIFTEATPEITLTPDDIAYIQYTGGTTGDPKGAILTHRNFVAKCLIFQKWIGKDWQPGEETGLSGFPFFHIAGLFTNGVCVYMAWTQVLIPNPRNTDHICAELKKYRPTVMANVPSLYMLLMENPKFKELDHSNLKSCVSAAAPFPEEAQRRFELIVGEGKVLEGYGMTETTGLTVINPSKRPKLGTIGVPLLNTDIRLVEPGTDREVKPGEPGEICVKGPQVMVGYHNKPEETRKVFGKDGYMRTGDVAIMDEDGFLRVVDRTKDMIIVSGFKVYSKKVEEVLREHPSISMVATVGIPNPERPGSEVVKAFIVLKSEYEIVRDKEALKDDIIHLAEKRLAPYEVPKVVEIRKELPLTSVGKVDKKALRRETVEVEERRRSMRKRVDLPCDVKGLSEGKGSQVTGHVVDISNGGMGLEAEKPLDSGTEVDAHIIDIVQFGTTFWVKGYVLGNSGNRMAVKFTEDIPRELRNLLRP